MEAFEDRGNRSHRGLSDPPTLWGRKGRRESEPLLSEIPSAPPVGRRLEDRSIPSSDVCMCRMFEVARWCNRLTFCFFVPEQKPKKKKRILSSLLKHIYNILYILNYISLKHCSDALWTVWQSQAVVARIRISRPFWFWSVSLFPLIDERIPSLLVSDNF